MVAQEIDLEEKRVCVPTPMTQEPFFSLPADATPDVTSLVATMNEDEEPILQVKVPGGA